MRDKMAVTRTARRNVHLATNWTRGLTWSKRQAHRNFRRAIRQALHIGRSGAMLAPVQFAPDDRFLGD